ncbi:hypothetical protein SOHN41_02919 [Shewanella sp. HN-41]|nr:hypothetical protein SOHN41_02919 [Shewanella sp. HN-41]
MLNILPMFEPSLKILCTTLVLLINFGAEVFLTQRLLFI